MTKTHLTFSFQKKWLYDALHLVVLALSLVLVICISVDTFKNIAFYSQPEFLRIQFWICILFLLDFILEFSLASDKKSYFKTHFVFLLVSIPYQSIIGSMGYTPSDEVAYLLHFIPLIRGGYALAIVVGWFTYNKATGLFVTYLAVMLSTIYFSSLAFYVAERETNTSVSGFDDALWWAFMNATTVGSNIVAVTTTGRVLSVLTAAAGVMMFPIFTVYITSLIEKRNQQKEVYYHNRRQKKTDVSE